MTLVTCRLTAKNRDQPRKPNARQSSMGYIFLPSHTTRCWQIRLQGSPSVNTVESGQNTSYSAPVSCAWTLITYYYYCYYYYSKTATTVVVYIRNVLEPKMTFSVLQNEHSEKHFTVSCRYFFGKIVIFNVISSFWTYGKLRWKQSFSAKDTAGPAANHPEYMVGCETSSSAKNIWIYFSKKMYGRNFYQRALENYYGLKLAQCWLQF